MAYLPAAVLTIAEARAQARFVAKVRGWAVTGIGLQVGVGV